jgi:hypothetical protein
MSQLEVDKVIPQSGTTLTLGDSADTITIPSGATLDASNATLTLPDDSVTTAKIDDGAVTSAKITYPLTTFSSTGIDDDGTSTAITINSSNNVALAGNIGLGGATPTTSGTGITFPASASASTNANTLDDYEEGTWTPTVVPASGTVTLSAAHGSYTKIGRVVYLTAFCVVSSVGSPSGQLNLQSIPFTPKNEDPNSSAHAVAYYNWTSGTYFLNGETAVAGNQIIIWSNNNGVRSDAGALIQGGSQFHLSGFYYV